MKDGYCEQCGALLESGNPTCTWCKYNNSLSIWFKRNTNNLIILEKLCAQKH